MDWHTPTREHSRPRSPGPAGPLRPPPPSPPSPPAGGAAAGEVTKLAIPESLALPDENVAIRTESAKLPELVEEGLRLIFDWA